MYVGLGSQRTPVPTQPLHTLTEVQAERCRRSLAYFVRHMWTVLEPGTPLRWTWHLDRICDRLERVTNGEIRRLVICQPPGTMKSLSLAFWFCWEMLRNPAISRLYLSKAPNVATRDSMRCRDLIVSEEYQRVVHALATMGGPKPWALREDQNTKTWFATTARGERQTAPINGAFMGARVRCVVIDDPLDLNDVRGAGDRVRDKMEDLGSKIRTKVSSRLVDQNTDPLVLVQQRLHVNDPAGMGIALGWEHLVLPAEYDPRHPHLAPDDPRETPGEPIDPYLFSPEVVARLKREMGHRDWQTLYQQMPVEADGGLFKTSNWVKLPRAQFPQVFDRVIAYWDLAFEGAASSDYTAGVMVGQKGAMFYVLDLVHRQMHYPEQRAAVVRLHSRWPQCRATVIEKAANASALIADLRNHLPGLVAVPVRDDKVARAQAVSPIYEAQQVVVPEEADWADSLILEHAAFPHGSYDDQVDALGGAILWCQTNRMLTQAIAIDPGEFSQESHWRD